MSSAGSVSTILPHLQAGDEAAFARLHDRYWPVAVALARNRLPGTMRHNDPEDVAQNAFIDLYRAIKNGRTPRLQNRFHLLALLTTIVGCKAINHVKGALAGCRDARRLQPGAVMEALAQEEAYTPLQAALLKDFYEFCLNSLPEKLRPYAEMYLAGCKHAEMAAHLGVVERTVERKIDYLLTLWRDLAKDSLQRDLDFLTPPGGASTGESGNPPPR